jgi:hypothetical protein
VMSVRSSTCIVVLLGQMQCAKLLLNSEYLIYIEHA